MGVDKKVIYSAKTYRDRNGRMRLGLSKGMPEDVKAFYKGQWRDYFLRKKRQKEDPEYDPLWNPIQTGFELVYSGRHPGIIFTKE